MLSVKEGAGIFLFLNQPNFNELLEAEQILLLSVTWVYSSTIPFRHFYYAPPLPKPKKCGVIYECAPEIVRIFFVRYWF